MMWITHHGRVFHSDTAYDGPVGKRQLAREYLVEFGHPVVLTWWCNYRERQITRAIDRWKLGKFVGKRKGKRWH